VPQKSEDKVKFEGIRAVYVIKIIIKRTFNQRSDMCKHSSHTPV